MVVRAVPLVAGRSGALPIRTSNTARSAGQGRPTTFAQPPHCLPLRGPVRILWFKKSRGARHAWGLAPSAASNENKTGI